MRQSLITRTWGLLCLALTLLLTGCGGEPGSSFTGPTAMPDAVRAAATQGNPALVWGTLPKSWQADIDGLMHDLAKAVPADLYDQAMVTVGKLVHVLQTKKEFVLGSPLVKAGMAELTPSQQAQVGTVYDDVVAFGVAFSSSCVQTTDRLARASVGDLLQEFGPQAWTAVVAVARFQSTTPGYEGRDAKEALVFFEALKNLSATIVSQTDTSAVIAVSMPGLPERQQQQFDREMGNLAMVPIDGRWVPAKMSSTWAEPISEAKAGIAMLASQFSPDNPQAQQGIMMVQMGLGMFDKMLDDMAKATTQAQFDQALGGMAALMSGMGGF